MEVRGLGTASGAIVNMVLLTCAPLGAAPPHSYPMNEIESRVLRIEPTARHEFLVLGDGSGLYSRVRGDEDLYRARFTVPGNSLNVLVVDLELRGVEAPVRRHSSVSDTQRGATCWQTGESASATSAASGVTTGRCIGHVGA